MAGLKPTPSSPAATMAASSSDASQSSAAEPPAAQPPSAAPTAPETEPIFFGATLESYYQFNWNRSPDRSLPLRAYDTRANSFSLQQIALVIDAPSDVAAGRRYGARVDLQFGQATETVQGSAANEPRPDVYRHVWQAYGSYVFPVGANGLQTDVGKFASNLGFETNYAKDNLAFSRAYLFNFLPFYHAGVRVTFPVNDKLTLQYLLTNGIQQTEDFNDFKSNQVVAVIKLVPAVSWTVNYYTGVEQPDGGEVGGPDGRFTVFDTYATVALTPALSLGVDVNHATNELVRSDPSLALDGIGAYGRYQVTSPFAVGIRYERIADEGLFGGIEQTLHEVTLTAEHKLADGFIMRGEFRRDSSNERFFPGRRGTDDLRRSQPTALIGAVWVFGSKKGTW